MRRKSERTASKKTKASPEKAEKKVEKPKRTRSKRKKQSSSSENESADEASPAPEAPVVVEPEPKPPTTPVKGEGSEESADQVWQVKTAGAGDVGEIQKLKICLTRPPSTPERAERSPRSKRKHSRATSSSDTPSVEAPEDRRKSRHRSKRTLKDDSEKNLDSQGEELETAADSQEKNDDEVTQSEEEQKADTPATSENTISTSDEKKAQDQGETKNDDENGESKEKVESSDDVTGKGEESTEKADKPSDADTTVVSPKAETTAVSAPAESESSANTESQDEQPDEKTSMVSHSQSPARRRSMSVDKSEILELHPEESKCESDLETDKTKADDTMEDTSTSQEEKQVSKTEEKSPTKETKLDNDKSNITGVVEKSKRARNISTDSHKDVRKSTENQESKDNRRRSQSVDSSKDIRKSQDTKPEENQKNLERSDSIQSNQEETILNGQAFTPIVVSRKRRWGSRPAKITTQKSITISSDILKDIISDVKPVEFEEVIEEKKPKKDREVVEKIERPVLPKIVIDNTENVERNINHQRLSGEKDRDREIMKPKEPTLAANRKISIIKDNDSIIARPPSPPRNKQSSVLYITNLVRPFTLPQLKNLLQRTGRLVENGFWIDKIKSKCYVIYENEDQAIETRHALHGVTWPVSNPKTLQVDFSTQEAFEKAKLNEVADNAQVSTIPGTVEDWLREQDMKRERGELDKPWERKVATREWDLGKNEKEEKDMLDKRREEPRPLEKRRYNRTPERSPEPARKFKKKEEEPPAKLLDDLFKKTKATPCIYWLPLSAETIAIKEEQRRQHMAEHERRMAEQRARTAARRH